MPVRGGCSLKEAGRRLVGRKQEVRLYQGEPRLPLEVKEKHHSWSDCKLPRFPSGGLGFLPWPSLLVTGPKEALGFPTDAQQKHPFLQAPEFLICEQQKCQSTSLPRFSLLFRRPL